MQLKDTITDLQTLLHMPEIEDSTIPYYLAVRKIQIGKEGKSCGTSRMFYRICRLNDLTCHTLSPHSPHSGQMSNCLRKKKNRAHINKNFMKLIFHFESAKQKLLAWSKNLSML